MDRLETELSDRLQIIHLNVHEPVGQKLGNHFDFRVTPTFIFFDSNGTEQWRSVGALDVEHVRRTLTEQ